MARQYSTTLLTAVMFTVVNVSALILSVPFLHNEVASYQAFEDPDDPFNPVFYIVAIIVFTALLLFAIRLFKERVVKYLILFSVFTALMYVFLLPATYGVSMLTGYAPYTWGAFLTGSVTAAVAAVFLTALLNSNPEWYIVDGVGILVASGVTAILGISLSILPEVILLVGLAAYDYVAVYRTKHMLTLADAVTKQRVPVMLVVPAKKDYSFKRSGGFSKEKEKVRKGKRDALFIGLGDVIIPGSLVVSSFVFLPAEPLLWGITTNLAVAAAVFLGTMAGFAVLTRMVAKGKPHAGLPLLNGGALLLFVVSYILVFRDFSFGIGFLGG